VYNYTAAAAVAAAGEGAPTVSQSEPTADAGGEADSQQAESSSRDPEKAS